MSSKERVLLQGVPHYVVHKTRDGSPIFRTTVDFNYCERQLLELRREYEVEIHAWCLLPGEVHLLITPTGRATEVSRFMKGLSCRTALFFKKIHGEESPWESRFLSTPVQPSQWVLTIMRMIELLPVTMGLVQKINQYAHSSLRMRCEKTQTSWLDDPEPYLRLGANRDERRLAYREYLRMGNNPKEVDFIVNAVTRGLVTGSDRFIREVAEKYGERVYGRPRGRPRKSPRQEGESPPGDDSEE
ncbi:hypothetical protein A6D6_03452 [Alcanivorax xiamenensis]|uniref:Transposase IS200-like domain-containing protein n=1 Tax=Alcanivorax xiamenensis TaxID=1177156 RepID=A0ABQ6Y581_9GAMM|nr:transposase [Alcanivorax xiamenensis]KAF0804061.1 hypothetical protein A6D6_03452 [Alcanivorax xiamenensis]